MFRQTILLAKYFIEHRVLHLQHLLLDKQQLHKLEMLVFKTECRV